MFMAVIAFGLYILFTMDESQAMSLNSVTKQVNSMSKEAPLPTFSTLESFNKSSGNHYNAL